MKNTDKIGVHETSDPGLESDKTARTGARFSIRDLEGRGKELTLAGGPSFKTQPFYSDNSGIDEGMVGRKGCTIEGIHRGNISPD